MMEKHRAEMLCLNEKINFKMFWFSHPNFRFYDKAGVLLLGNYAKALRNLLKEELGVYEF